MSLPAWVMAAIIGVIAFALPSMFFFEMKMDSAREPAYQERGLFLIYADAVKTAMPPASQVKSFGHVSAHGEDGPGERLSNADSGILTASGIKRLGLGNIAAAGENGVEVYVWAAPKDVRLVGRLMKSCEFFRKRDGALVDPNGISENIPEMVNNAIPDGAVVAKARIE